MFPCFFIIFIDTMHVLRLFQKRTIRLLSHDFYVGAFWLRLFFVYLFPVKLSSISISFYVLSCKNGIQQNGKKTCL